MGVGSLLRGLNVPLGYGRVESLLTTRRVTPNPSPTEKRESSPTFVVEYAGISLERQSPSVRSTVGVLRFVSWGRGRTWPVNPERSHLGRNTGG